MWAPAAQRVHLAAGEALRHARIEPFQPSDDNALERRDDGTWTGFLAGARDGEAYRFWVVREGSSGF